MIDGLYIQMTTEDLRKHLRLREVFHYKEANKARVLGGGDPWAGIKKLEEQQRAERKYHQRRSMGFGLLAERLIENEVYRLSKANCDEIELFEGDGK